MLKLSVILEATFDFIEVRAAERRLRKRTRVHTRSSQPNDGRGRL